MKRPHCRFAHLAAAAAPGFHWKTLLRSTATGLAAAVLMAVGFSGPAPAQSTLKDALKVAIGQRGGWEQSVAELGQNAGFFMQQGIVLDILYTQGSAETLQSVISGSVDIGVGQGAHALLGAVAKGAPLKVIGSSFTSADDQYYYVPADSPLKDIKGADGKSIAVSTTGSASHIFSLALARHYGINLKAQPTGNYASTLTQALTKQVDIGFSQAPFNLNAVEDGRIRIIAMGRDVPELRSMTSRLIIANAGALESRRDVFSRFGVPIATASNGCTPIRPVCRPIRRGRACRSIWRAGRRRSSCSAPISIPTGSTG